MICRQHNRNPTPVQSPMSSSVCPNAILSRMQQGNRRLCRVVSKVCKERVEAVNRRRACVLASVMSSWRYRALSACEMPCLCGVSRVFDLQEAECLLPLFRLLYTNSTTTSISFTAAPLKCLRTFVASCSLETRLLSFRLAIVGDCRPIPGLTKSAWFSGDVKAAGVERLCETRYVFSSDNGVVLQAICTSVSPTRIDIRMYSQNILQVLAPRCRHLRSLPPALSMRSHSPWQKRLPLRQHSACSSWRAPRQRFVVLVLWMRLNASLRR
jgi:hypothetical protein